jgi:hypothetical protein
MTIPGPDWVFANSSMMTTSYATTLIFAMPCEPWRGYLALCCSRRCRVDNQFGRFTEEMLENRYIKREIGRAIFGRHSNAAGVPAPIANDPVTFSWQANGHALGG